MDRREVNAHMTYTQERTPEKIKCLSKCLRNVSWEEAGSAGRHCMTSECVVCAAAYARCHVLVS